MKSGFVAIIIASLCSSCASIEIKPTGEVLSNGQVKNLIKKLTNTYYLRDNKYKIIDQKYFDEVLVNYAHTKRKMVYMKEAFDCDDFVITFLAYANIKFAIDNGAGIAPSIFFVT